MNVSIKINDCDSFHYRSNEMPFVVEMDGKYVAYVGEHLITYIRPNERANMITVGMFSSEGNPLSHKYLPEHWRLDVVGWDWSGDHYETTNRQLAYITARLFRSNDPINSVVYTFHDDGES